MKKNIFLILTMLLLSTSILAQSRNNLTDTPKELKAGLADLSQQISKDLSENQKRRVAVLEFVDLKGNVTDFGRYLSEKLITNLFKTRKVRVIERQLLNKIIKEQKLSLTGIIDPVSAQKLGKLLGVDAIASGSVSDLTKTIEINARLISTETGEVFSAASVEIVKNETVCNLMGECNGTSMNSTPSNNRIISKTKSWKESSNFFTFELLNCRISGSSAICNFNVTNNDSDRRLTISHKSTLFFDDLGNSTSAYEVKFGNSKTGYAFFGNYEYGDIVSGVTASGRIVFNKVSSKGNKITLLRVSASDGSNKFKFDFRNIPLRQK